MRTEPKVVIEVTTENCSSRAGAKPAIIVLHSTESSNRSGASDLAGVASWFRNPAARASAHVIVDAEGQSARVVRDVLKSWACAGYNAVSLNIEQIGYASQGRWADAEIDEAARWIAHWSRKWRIPIRKGRTLGGRVIRKGVVTHSSLGTIGGGHSDPGKGYPLRKVLRRAKRFKG